MTAIIKNPSVQVATAIFSFAIAVAIFLVEHFATRSEAARIEGRVAAVEITLDHKIERLDDELKSIASEIRKLSSLCH